MRIVVTGGAGFLGSHLCDYLITSGHEVICIDNLITGQKSNIKDMCKHPSFSFIHQDITDPSMVVPSRIDAIFHLACPASPPDYLSMPIWTLQACSAGTQNMLDIARHSQAIFILASTSEVYGDPHESPQREEYWGNVNPIGPRSVYDEGKRYAEALTMAYGRHRGVNVRIARIFNTYGPLMRPNDGRVVSNFITQALSGHDITVYGNGLQTRSLCYVDDLIRGLVKLMESKVEGPVNLGNPDEVRVIDLAREIISMTGSNSKVVHRPLPQDDPMRRCPDITRAKSVLGWAPKITRREGLGRTIEYFRSLLAAQAREPLRKVKRPARR